jgi:molecular chaperone DnaJ
MDLYKCLGLEKTATADEIKKAYRKKAMDHHPDRNVGDPKAESLFKEAAQAYSILGDAEKRARYDATGSTTTSGPGFRSHHTSSSSSSGWSFFSDAPPTNPAERGRNIYVNVELELHEVLTEVKRKIKVPQRERCIKCEGAGYKEFKACTTCSGSGKVAMKVPGFNMYTGCGSCRGTGRAGTVSCEDCKGEGCLNKGENELEIPIPAGIATGNQIKVANQGEPARNIFGKNGDLLIIIVVKDHKFFTREGANLFVEMPVGYAELALGTKLEVPTLEKPLVITVPPRTKDFTQFRLKGHGIPYLHNKMKGDLLVSLKLMVPPKDKIEELTPIIDSLKKIEDDYLSKEREKFNEK